MSQQDRGRYLSPEPLLQSPAYVRRMAQRGMSVPTYAYAANNPLRSTDPTGLDVWMEGPSRGEPQGHLSINVGTADGYESFSFGLTDFIAAANFLGQGFIGPVGEVYRDVSTGGAIPLGFYFPTDAADDVRIRGELASQLGRRSYYGPPSSTCRDYSNQQFNSLKDRYSVPASFQPPARTPQSGAQPIYLPSTSFTSNPIGPYQ